MQEKRMDAERRPEPEESTLVRELNSADHYGSTEVFNEKNVDGIVELSQFEDVLEIIGTHGRWNYTIFFICSLAPFANAFQAITYEFLGFTPEYWCHIEPLVEANWTQQQILFLSVPPGNGSRHDSCTILNYNYTKAAEIGYEAAIENRDSISLDKDGTPILCHARDFDTSVYTSTVVTEWDLVCERRALYSTTQAATQAGSLVGSLLFSYLLDTYGRRPAVLVCIILSLASSVATALSPTLWFYVLMRGLVSCFSTGFYMGCFVQVMELCSTSQRSSMGTLFVMPWAIGYIIVPGIAYVIKPWRWLQVAYSIPILFLVPYFWLVPESPRWLISAGYHKKAVEVLAIAAKTNRTALPPEETLFLSLNAMIPLKREGTQEKISHLVIDSLRHIFSLIIDSDFRVKTLICYFCWFGVSMVYSGVSLNAENLSVDLYVYVFLGGVVEVFSYIFLLLMMKCVGRKSLLSSFYLLCAVNISIIAILMVVLDTVPVAMKMFLSLSGKLAITAAYHLLYIFTAELFPTNYRSLAIGQCGMMARTGGMVSPYINDLLGANVSWSPSVLFAAVSIVAAGLFPILPETKGANLTEETSSQSKSEPEEVSDENRALISDSDEP